MWSSLPDHSDEGLSVFLDRFTPVLAGAQSTIASLTAAYLTELVNQQYGSRLSAPTFDPSAVTGAALRNGVTPDVEYRRPFETVWYGLSQGKEPATAQADGLLRAQSMLSADLQLSRTHAARGALQELSQQAHIVGYARVLGGGHSCDLCVIASSQRYHIEDLMPIHNRCSCSVEPIFTDAPIDSIGQRLNSGDEDSSSALEIRQHGELGPVLTFRDQHFRGPEDVARDSSDEPSGAETAAD